MQVLACTPTAREPEVVELPKCATPSFSLADDTTMLFCFANDSIRDSVHFEMTLCEDSTGEVLDNWSSKKYRGVYDVLAYAYREGCQNSDTIYGRHVQLYSPTEKEQKSIVVYDSAQTMIILGLKDYTPVTFYNSKMYFMGETLSKDLRLRFILPEEDDYVFIETGYTLFRYVFRQTGKQAETESQ